MPQFSQLPLISPIQKALVEQGYTRPTPIQQQAIPQVLLGKDVLGCAQTGTGKTAAFLLPMLQVLVSSPIPKGHRPIRTLILSPTRELAAQIGDSCTRYAAHLPLRHTVIYGGVKQGRQVETVKRGVDVLIATPGRLLDLQNQGFVSLKKVSFFVLDEADRMLDMGFLPDIRRLLNLLPKKRQNLLFSATMPPDISKLASGFLHEPVRIEVAPQSSTVDQITQKVMFVEKPNKRHLMLHLLQTLSCSSSIVFTRTKHGANRLVTHLQKNGVRAAAIHGNKSQNARLRALADFTSRTISVLVATDIASRGIDVEGVSHVFNYDLPNISESYVHRIGRTGRAGASGAALSFCQEDEVPFLFDIERLIGKEIEEEVEHQWHCNEAFRSMTAARKKGIPKQQRKKSQKSNHGRNNKNPYRKRHSHHRRKNRS